jgi:hypothetical protein
MPAKKQAEKNNSIRSEAVTDLREIKQMIKKSIENGAKDVEQVHQAIAAMPFKYLENQAIAAMPFKYLEKVQFMENTARNVKEAQEKTIGQVYDLLSDFRAKVDELAEKMLEKAEG